METLEAQRKALGVGYCDLWIGDRLVIEIPGRGGVLGTLLGLDEYAGVAGIFALLDGDTTPTRISSLEFGLHVPLPREPG